MDNIEHMERKLKLPARNKQLPFDERLERIRFALIDIIDADDPESAVKLEAYGKTDLVCFIDHLVQNDEKWK